MRATTILLACLAGGCAAPGGGALTSLQREVQRLRAEQERQGHELELLRNRVVLTEDAARQARNALEGAGRNRVISLGTEPVPEETIRVDATGGGDDPGQGPEPEPSTPPTRIRITGNEPMPQGPSFVVRDRLPVVPVPPAPTTGPGTTGTTTGTPPTTTPAPRPRERRNERETPPTQGPQASQGTSLDPDALAAYESALGAARGGRCAEALGSFDAFLLRWPTHPYAVNAMYWRGECFLQGGELRRAANEFEGLIARFPVGSKVPDALYKLAVCYRRLGDREAADRAARRLLDEFPDSHAARRARGERQ